MKINSGYLRLKQPMAFDYFNMFMMILLCVITVYPVWFVLVNSFNEGMDAMRGGIFLWPRVFTLDNYKVVFMDNSILWSFMITIARTVVGALTGTFFIAAVAYGMSKKYLIGRKYYLIIGTVTLFFSGGLIPSFLLIRGLGLYDNFLVYIIPSMFNFYTMIIFQAYYKQIPEEMEEAAKIDGANDILIFVRIIIPLSMPIIAAFILISGVYHWNDYFVGVIYTQSKKLEPIQTFLYRIVYQYSENQSVKNFQAAAADNDRTITSEAVKLATMVVTTAPIVFTYPFLQKYFVKGLMVGSVKG